MGASEMAERKATNKYYPPEWEPKNGSINKYRGQHPLRERARKLSQGILIVRFEMPYNVWCLSCDAHIGKGVRYNAEKKQIGKYFSTKIWSFRMKCHLCSAWMEVQTDPENRDYKMASGVKRKEETWDERENETEVHDSDAHKERLQTDPFYRLENSAQDKASAEIKKPQLQKLIEHNYRSYDDFGASQVLRHRFREKKKEIKELKDEAQSKGLHIDLLPPDPEDQRQADSIKFQPKTNASSLKYRMMASSTSIFPNSSLSPSGLQARNAKLQMIHKAKSSKLNLSN